MMRRRTYNPQQFERSSKVRTLVASGPAVPHHFRQVAAKHAYIGELPVIHGLHFAESSLMAKEAVNGGT